MAIALVKQGTLATLTQSSGGSGTINPTFGQATTAGNLLIAVIWQGGVAGTSVATGTGWVEAGSGSVGAHIFYKKNCGASETAPTFNSNGGTYGAAQLLEFSGADITAPLDKAIQTTGGTTSPQSADMGAHDTNTDDLAVVVWNVQNSKTATYTMSDSWTPAGGTKVATVTDAATKQIPHGYASFWVNTAGGSADDINALTFTPSTGSVSSVAYAMASFKVTSPGVSGSATLTAATTLTAAGTSNAVIPLSATTSLTAGGSVNERASPTLALTTSLSAAGTVPPTPPTNVYAAGTPNTTTSMDVTWDSQGAGVTYDVDRSTDQSTWTNIASATSSTTITDTGRTSDTQYYYRVRATNFVGTSAYAQTSGRTGKSVTLTTPINLGTSELAVGGTQNWFLTVPTSVRIPTGGSVLLVVSLTPNHNVDAGRGGDATPTGGHDSAGNVYKIVSRTTTNSLDGQLYVIYCPVVAYTLLPGDTITVDFTGNNGFGSIVGMGFNGNLTNLNVDAASSSAQSMSRTTNTFTVTGGIEIMGWAKYWQVNTATTNPSSAAGWTTGPTDTYDYTVSPFQFQTFARIDYQTGYNGTALTDSMSFADGGGADWWALYATIVPIGASPVVEVNQAGAGGVFLSASTGLGFQSPGTDTTPINDTFNRGNQSGLGTADDGGTYTIDSGIAASISSNTAIITTGRNVFTESTGTAEKIVHRDVGTTSMDVTYTLAANSLTTSSYKKFWVAYDPSNGGGIMVAHVNSAATTQNMYVDFKPGVAGNPNVNTLWDSGVSLTDGASHTIRVRWDADKMTVQVWVDGTLKVTFGPVSSTVPYAGTHAGFVSSQANSTDGFAVDSWSATRLLPAITVAPPPVSATLVAATSLTPGNFVQQFGIATLSASTTLVAAAIDEPFGAATLAMSTTFSTSAFVTVQATASLAMTTGLTAATFVQEFAGDSLAAATSLSVAAVDTMFAAATLTAATTLGATGSMRELAAATLSATTTLSTTGTRGVPGTATLSAATTLTVAGSVTERAVSALTAATTLSVGNLVQELASATLTAVTALSATGFTQEQGIAALTAVMGLAVAASVRELAVASLPMTTSLTTTAVVTTTGTSSMTVTTALAAAGFTQERGVAALTAVTSLSATATTTGGASSGLVAQTSVTVAGFTQEMGVAALTATTSLTTTAVRGVLGGAALSATTSLSASGLVTSIAVSALSLQTSVSAAAFVQVLASTSLTAVTSLGAAGAVTERASTALSATTSLAVGASATELAAAALVAATALSASAADIVFGQATLLAATALVTAGGTVERGGATLSMGTGLTAGSFVEQFAQAALTATSVLVAAGQVAEAAAAGLTLDSTLVGDGVTTLFGAAVLSMVTSLHIVSNIFGALRDIQVTLGDRYDNVTLGDDAYAVAFGLQYDHIAVALPLLTQAVFGEQVDPVATGDRQDAVSVGDRFDPITLGNSGL